MTDTIYIGYGDLETMLASQAGYNRPVYLMLSEIPGKPDPRYGVGLNEFTLMIQDLAPQGVRYCRIHLGNTQTIGGQPADETEHRAVWERAREAYQIVRDYLVEERFAVEEATIAMPENYRYLNCHAAFLWYDREAGHYAYRRQETHKGHLRVKYICAACGEIADIPADVDILDNGTTFKCPHCQGDTVVDLDTLQERARCNHE